MLISHKHKFIFIKTRKTGGTSAEIALARICGPDDVVTHLNEHQAEGTGVRPRNHEFPESEWSMRARIKSWKGKRIPGRGSGFFQHMMAKDIRKHVDPDVWENYYKFTIERNPWDRQVSLFHWHYRKRTSPPAFETFIKSPFHRKKSRNWQMYTENDNLIVDRVIRYDDLQGGLDSVLSEIGVTPVELPRAKSGFRDQAGYRSYYNDDTRQIVGDWYASEISAFDFEF